MSCDNNEHEELPVQEPFYMQIQVFYKDSLSNEIRPDSESKIYLYYKTELISYSYVSDGKLIKNGVEILPDSILTTDYDGFIKIIPDQSKENISFIIESTYFRNKISLSEVIPKGTYFKGTVTFNR